MVGIKKIKSVAKKAAMQINIDQYRDTIKPNKKHPYHLVNLSPWPLVASLGALVTAIGLALIVHDYTTIPLFLGLVILCFSMFGWWKDVIHESVVEKKHTEIVQFGLKIGVVLFIVSEIMFFAAFFWAYFDASLFPMESIGQWPPKGIQTIDPFHLPYLNTLILLLSATSLTWSHAALLENNRKDAKKGLVITIILGLIFSCIQAYEFMEAPFAFKDGIYASTFYMLTGFHGAHVIIGTLFLMVCLWRLNKGQFKPDHHLGFEAAAWYWHFVDVVWLFLFVFLYWWGV
jgi:cytochrome c oxidase subunit 3